MSATPRASISIPPSRVKDATGSNSGRDTQFGRKRSKDFGLGESYHRIIRWYPSISDTPEEPIVRTVNGVMTAGGSRARSERTESRVGTSSTQESDQAEPTNVSVTKHEMKSDKPSKSNLKNQESKE